MVRKSSGGRASTSKGRASTSKKSARSAPRKPRSTRKKRKKSFSLKQIIFVIAGLAILLMAVSWGIIYYQGRKAPVRLSCLHNQKEVTTDIFGVLFREGLSRQSVKWKSHGHVISFTIKSGRRKAQEVYVGLVKNLGPKYKGLRLKKNRHGTIRIFCGKRETHQLTFALPAVSYPAAETKPLTHVPPVARARLPKVKAVKVAIVIDDIGYDLSIARNFLDLPVPVTLSVFPYAPHSKEIVREAQNKRHEVMMHLPMEPEGYPGKGKDPGPGALYVKMSPPEIVRQINSDLDRIPEVCGVNNHMGSRFTCDPKGVKVLMETLKKRKKFFLDSRTSTKSVGFKIAEEEGIPTVKRDVFLDNVRDVKKIRLQLDHLVERAKKKGYGVGIGHTHSATYLALKKAIPDYQKEGVEFVFISSLVR